MSKKQLVGFKIMVTVVAVVAFLLILNLSYNAGRDKGRGETVDLIQQLADEYEFTIRNEDGWILGSSKGGEFFPNYDGSTLMHEYDWDDCKIHLSYEK